MTVVLLHPRRPLLVPVDAVVLLTGPVAYTEELPAAVLQTLPAAHPVHTAPDAPVLVSSDPEHPAVAARLAAGETLIATPRPATGERLLDAVAIMDRLRTDGAWEREQTHHSLRRYLLEETYELFDAVDSGDAAELRAELGDVLLQVLFHARIAEEAPEHSFTVDDVADALVGKLATRAANVLAGERVTRDDQLAQWERHKASEQTRTSVTDGVPTGQPSLALAQKIIRRATRAGFPEDLIPDDLANPKLALNSDVDAEMVLRSAVLAFIDTIRRAEREIREIRAARGGAEAAELGEIGEQEWRTGWSGAQG